MVVDSVGYLALIFFGYLTVELALQFIPLLKVLRAACSSSRPVIQDLVLPEARVLLCLKGTDPFLDRCLNGLATQDYPNYKVIIIVDSENDEAVPQSMELREKYGPERVQLMFRKHLISTCTRKMSSLVSGLEQLDGNVEIVVVCDGDCIPHNNWLRDLVRPIVQEGAKATSGNRWYVPSPTDFGGQVRYFWNALAAPRMYQEGIIWAGSMAISREVFADPEFVVALRQAFSEDTKVVEYLHQKFGTRAFPQPDVPVINSESTTFAAFWGFLLRQMLAARLHHPSWPGVFRNAVLLVIVMWILFPLAAIRGSSALIPWMIGLGIYAIVIHLCIGLCEWYIRQFVKQTRNQALPRYGWRRVLLCVPAATTLGFIYPIAVLVAAFAKTHVWRGITYRILRNGVQVVAAPADEPEINAATTPHVS